MSADGPPAGRDGRLARWLPALLVPVALLPDLAAALPLRSYFFRDLTVTFLPLRLFAAEELRAGRLASWNRYLFEGSFQLPSLYPVDLLHALWPSPLFVSWLLTLHLPLAALGAYWLARQLGASRPGSFATGVAFALGGFALSCLNLYVFLQALALMPWLAGALRRAALRDRRAVVAAAAALALGLSTLAVEFVLQAVVLGLALGVAAAGRRGAPRLVAALALGVGLAGLPVALVVAVLPETVRGLGFAPDVALGNALHPLVLLQTQMPHLFGDPAAPVGAWWGGRFFTKGAPYFLSLYVGPLAFGLAWLGLGRLGRSERRVLLLLSLLGLWYALGASAGLASAASRLPFASAFRFPTKALLLPHVALALLAGFGVDRLRQDARSFRRLAAVVASLALASVVVVVLLAAGGRWLAPWSRIAPGFWPALCRVIAGDALVLTTIALATVALAVVVRLGLVARGRAVVFVVGLLVADLALAGRGLNPQVAPAFFELLPELRRLALSDATGGRVFSYPVERSPAFLSLLARGGRQLDLLLFFVDRQALGPYTNLLDRVESPEATDLTAFAPRRAEIGPVLLEPTRFAELVPWLRNAAVSRVLSLDALAHPDLRELGTVPLGPPGLALHVYSLEHGFPRASVACRVLGEEDHERALSRPYGPGFDAGRDVVLESGAATDCSQGRVVASGDAPSGQEAYETEADGAGFLVVRESFARGWTAVVDGRPAAVLRANGKHMALRVPAGRHRVQMRYRPPGLRVGVAVSLASLLTAIALVSLGRREPRP